VGAARFWVTEADEAAQRFSPQAIDGTTGRTLLVVDDPDDVVSQAVQAGARNGARS
jgi:hypothetical protein